VARGEEAVTWSFRLGSRLALLAPLAVALSSAPRVAGAAEIAGSAILRDDGSLRIQGRRVRLHGIYTPDPGRVRGFCDDVERLAA
jgi:hypothetical protein